MVLDTRQAEAISLLAAGVDELLEVELHPGEVAEARALIRDLEVQARRVRAAQVRVLDQVDRNGLYRADGHASAKVMVRHVANLSNAEACRRASSAKALRELTGVAAAFGEGRIGGCQVERIARVHANGRVRTALVDNEDCFVTQAEAVEYQSFDRMVGEWVSVVDEDGTRDTNQRHHDNRDAKLIQGLDGSWELSGGCASFAGRGAGADLQGVPQRRDPGRLGPGPRRAR